MTIFNNLRIKERTARLAMLAAAFISAQTALAVDYFQRLAMEGVEIVGAVTYGLEDAYTVMQSGFYEFPYDSKFAPDKKSPIKVASLLGGCVYHDGKIYANEFNAHQQDVKPMWRIYDAKTFNLISEHELKDNCECTTTSLAYDPTTDYIYGFNETYTETYVVRIDPNTGEMVRLGDFLDRNYKFFCMACSPDGDLYCTYLNKMTDAVYLGKIRKSTGQVAMIRGISATNLFGGDSFINSSYDQSLFFNNATGKMYWMFQSSSLMLYKSYTPIFEVDPLTASAVMVAYLEDAIQGPGAFFLEPDMKAPGVISEFEWTPDEEGTEAGTISFNIPATAYDGSELNGTLRLTIESDDTQKIEADVTPGEGYTAHLDDLKNGWVNLKIHVSNEAGDGPTVKRTFYAGYDVPKAPSNIRLTSSGLRTFLNWEAPTEGVNGKAINTDDLTYTIVRYPGEETIATDYKGTSFEEDHPEDMTRYVYSVTAKADGKTGRVGWSNNLIVGTPLDIPYGGEFKFAADLYNYYTILDSNGDGYTWMYDTSTFNAYYPYNMAQGANDWMISPALNYKKGTTYEVAFKAYSSSSSYKEALQVTWGADKTPEAQSNVLLDISELPSNTEETMPEEYKVRFTAPDDGVYYYAFHAVSDAFREYLYLGNVRIYEYNPDATAIKSVNGDGSMLVNSEKGVLNVTLGDDAQVVVYDMSGRTVAKANGKSVSIPLKSGAYVISVNGKSIKAIVK